MKNKVWLVGILVAVVLLGTFGASRAFAQEPQVPPAGDAWNTWDMFDYCHGAGGMMGGYGTGFSDPVTLGRAADALGLTYEQLTARLAQGETIAQVAQAQEVDVSLVVNAILEPQSEILKARVEYGYLTEAEAQAILDQARLWIQQAITAPQYGPTTGPTTGYYGPMTNPTTGYSGGGYWGGGMMGGGMMGGGTFGGGTFGGGRGGMMGGGWSW